MLVNVFRFWSSYIGKCVAWLFNDFVINDNPRITFGMFLIVCFTIGFALYFVLGSDFIPTISDMRSSDSKSKSKSSDDNYKPRHSPGNAGKNYNTRTSRHNYKD